MYQQCIMILLLLETAACFHTYLATRKCFVLAAAYVVCILNGERLNDLPIQVPTKY